ncbi:helix-turn-helix transcriptional regulator [Sphingomonas sp. SUN019]|uniref:helix-turn-helix domain-containing protein n=1 Tax=Sphingomonas sp. SUN019 TaxID=2937788 RepID=UPI0021646CF9|nr:helix-turn-helix transcriptional regulator [Sphingomonas sp. SUN019]UVO50256.1 helix-turn-helix transcriptional regulator [Sphingomonas sp. SUN019]
MDDTRFDALSPRHRDCLRLVRARMRTKEIALELSIAPSTIDGYIAEAVRIIGARDRREAAMLLEQHEAKLTPDQSGGQSSRVAPAPVPPAPIDPPDEVADWRSSLPIRRKGARYNDLSMAKRMAWIVGLALLMLIAFGQLTSGLKVASDLIGARGDQ